MCRYSTTYSPKPCQNHKRPHVSGPPGIFPGQRGAASILPDIGLGLAWRYFRARLSIELSAKKANTSKPSRHTVNPKPNEPCKLSKLQNPCLAESESCYALNPQHRASWHRKSLKRKVWSRLWITREESSCSVRGPGVPLFLSAAA